MSFRALPNEKVVFSGKFISVKLIHRISYIAFVATALISLICFLSDRNDKEPFVAAFMRVKSVMIWTIIAVILFILTLITGIIWVLIHTSEVKITTRRVYAKSFFRREVNIPLEKIVFYGSAWQFILPNIQFVRSPSGRIFISLLTKESGDEFMSTIQKLVNGKETYTDEIEGLEAAEKICPHCGAVVDDDMLFCGECGKKL
jgi:ribosomal protein S27AE